MNMTYSNPVLGSSEGHETGVLIRDFPGVLFLLPVEGVFAAFVVLEVGCCGVTVVFSVSLIAFAGVLTGTGVAGAATGAGEVSVVLDSAFRTVATGLKSLFVTGAGGGRSFFVSFTGVGTGGGTTFSTDA